MANYTLEQLQEYTRHTTVERLRKRYPNGTRVVLLQMDDPQAPPVGTKGTVYGVDDIANVLVCWDNGSRLNVAYGADRIGKVLPGFDEE